MVVNTKDPLSIIFLTEKESKPGQMDPNLMETTKTVFDKDTVSTLQQMELNTMDNG